MKAYLYSFFFLAILLHGCVGNKTKEPGNKQEASKAREDGSIDFGALGMENLNESSNMKDIICQTWEFKEDIADNADADPASNIERVYRGVCFFRDGTMIKDPRGNMLPGKWELNDKIKPITISFTLDNGMKQELQLAYLMPYEMKLAGTMDGKKYIADLNSEAIRFKELSNDPFYISNNLWRIKPAAAESDDKIKKRLKDCVHFFILFYEQKIKAKSDAVSFIGLPSPFKWYGGGIYLQAESKVQPKWVNTFYNRDQAMKAYKLADKLMDHKYEWPRKEYNWLKQNVYVLKQMEARIDSL